MTTVPPRDADTRDEDLLADLFDTLLQDILEGRTPDLASLHPDRPDLRDRIAKTWHLACSVAGRREPSRPVLGGYEILRELGHGGMGTVYLARHQTLQRDVAIKVLPQSLAMSPLAKQRFLEEARALARIRHDHVVHIHRIIDHSEMLAFEMEYVDGPSLQSLILALRQQPKPFALQSLVDVLGHDVDAGVRSSVEWYVRLGIRIARALAEVHRHGLVHRDVKPSNILLRADGTPVLADFGLALQGELDATRTKFAGTPVYAAPERLRGGDGTIDARTDVYSLGVTLYEALTSSPPFAGSSTHEVLRRIESGDAPSLRQRAPHASRDLAIVIAKAMEPDPRHRYATADDFADDLERLLSLQPITARPPGPLRRTWQFVRRHQRVVTAATAGALLVALLSWPIVAHAGAASEARQRAAAALQAARMRLLCPEALPSSWSAQPGGGLTLRRSSAVAASARAFADSLDRYAGALAAAPDDERLRLEHAVVAAVAALQTAPENAPAIATGPLPPLCQLLVREATAHRRLTDGLAEALAAASDSDRFAAGLFAFLCGDYAASTQCWAELPQPLREDPLVDACGALQLADQGAPERAYPRLFHAARAFPGATAIAFALADAALAAGDTPLARQWIAALPAAQGDATDHRRRLLAADLLAAEGDWEGAWQQYRQLAADDATDPAPLQRLSTLALRRDDRAAAKRMLHQLLQRWPDLALARQQLARLSLQERDLATYLDHARHALGQIHRESTSALVDLSDILRLGGLRSLYAEVAPAPARGRTGARGDDGLPLASWLRPSTVRGIEAALRLLAVADAASQQSARSDTRPAGVALRTVWWTALQLPELTWRLPWSSQGLLLAGIPALLGEPTDLLTAYLLPFQRALGDRLHATPDRRLFSRDIAGMNAVYGSQLLRVDDLDGDSLAEICIASPPDAEHPGDGCIEIRSAADGALLRTWRHLDENAMFGRAMASLGDVDGDLCDDILLGLPLSRIGPDSVAAVELWSGRSGHALWRLEDPTPSFGVTVASLGDVDGDGVRDFVVGRMPMRIDGDQRGAAFVGSGRTGAILHELAAERSGTWFGGAVANAHDVSGDGIDDVVVGGNFGGAPGLVAVHDGRTGKMLTSFTDAGTATDFGSAVLGVGDLDGDGTSEIAISAPGRSSRGSEAGKVLVLSIRTGKTFYELRGERGGEGFGAGIGWLPDWRRDGAPALVVSTAAGGPVGNGYVRIFDLRSGRPLQTFAGNPAHASFGYAFTDLGDRDGDGLRELGAVAIRQQTVDFYAMTYADAFLPAADAEVRPRRK